MNEYLISAWAEKMEQGWLGIATVDPAIPNQWTSGPQGDSLVTVSVYLSEYDAERAVTLEMMEALAIHLKVDPGEPCGGP